MNTADKSLKHHVSIPISPDAADEASRAISAVLASVNLWVKRQGGPEFLAVAEVGEGNLNVTIQRRQTPEEFEAEFEKMTGRKFGTAAA